MNPELPLLRLGSLHCKTNTCLHVCFLPFSDHERHQVDSTGN